MNTGGQSRSFPPGFEALEPLADDWLADSAEGRKQLRITHGYEDRLRFYELAGPMLAAALDHLDRLALATLTPAETNLLRLMKALGHVALSIEHYDKVDDVHARHLAAVTITRGTGLG